LSSGHFLDAVERRWFSGRGIFGGTGVTGGVKRKAALPPILVPKSESSLPPAAWLLV
jgi:hypothetical protein